MAVAKASATPWCERGKYMSRGVGAGAGAIDGERGCGFRDGVAGTHAGRHGSGPGDGIVHQYAAGADRRG